ncbi:MAG: co-chaperone GroES [bacterium]
MADTLKSSVRPLYDRILVKRLESEQKTAGGIYIPDTAQEKTQLGIVVAVGEGKVLADGKIRELIVKKSDKVLFGKFAGTEVSVDGQDFLILREDEVLGLIV